MFLALVLIGAGLISSTLHLGNPQRAWACAQPWRSSWLSREGVMALATFRAAGAQCGRVVFLDWHIVWPGVAWVTGHGRSQRSIARR